MATLKYRKPPISPESIAKLLGKLSTDITVTTYPNGDIDVEIGGLTVNQNSQLDAFLRNNGLERSP